MKGLFIRFHYPLLKCRTAGPNVWVTWQWVLYFSRLPASKVAIYHHWSVTASLPLKNGGWKTWQLSYWVLRERFRGRTGKSSGGYMWQQLGSLPRFHMATENRALQRLLWKMRISGEWISWSEITGWLRWTRRWIYNLGSLYHAMFKDPYKTIHDYDGIWSN